MSAARVEKIQKEIIQRYNHISNLYIAYMNSGKYPDEFGREFFHAVGEILQGVPVRRLTLFHLDAATIEEIVDHSTPKGGTANRKKKKITPRPKRKPTRKAKARKNRSIRRPSRRSL